MPRQSLVGRGVTVTDVAQVGAKRKDAVDEGVFVSPVYVLHYGVHENQVFKVLATSDGRVPHVRLEHEPDVNEEDPTALVALDRVDGIGVQLLAEFAWRLGGKDEASSGQASGGQASGEGRGRSNSGAAASMTGGVLGWQQRLSIAVGGARGLEHLHHGTPPTIHRDVKSM